MILSVRQKRLFAFVYVALVLAFFWLVVGPEPVKGVLRSALGFLVGMVFLYALGITSKEDERIERQAKSYQYLHYRSLTPEETDRLRRDFARSHSLRPFPPEADQGPDPAPV